MAYGQFPLKSLYVDKVELYKVEYQHQIDLEGNYYECYTNQIPWAN